MLLAAQYSQSFAPTRYRKETKMLTNWSEHSIIRPRRRRCHTRQENTQKKKDLIIDLSLWKYDPGRIITKYQIKWKSEFEINIPKVLFKHVLQVTIFCLTGWHEQAEGGTTKGKWEKKREKTGSEGKSGLCHCSRRMVTWRFFFFKKRLNVAIRQGVAFKHEMPCTQKGGVVGRGRGGFNSN